VDTIRLALWHNKLQAIIASRDKGPRTGQTRPWVRVPGDLSLLSRFVCLFTREISTPFSPIACYLGASQVPGGDSLTLHRDSPAQAEPLCYFLPLIISYSTPKNTPSVIDLEGEIKQVTA
jgi:hypothetical protein